MILQDLKMWALAGALLLLGGQVSATEAQMDRLPSSEMFACAICHISTSPTDSDLNDFAYDFRDLGDLWDERLAMLDSDGDGCTNGAELGDVDGNGILDEGVDAESSNPGLPGDCSSASTIDAVTWGQLKAMFDTR